MLNFPLMLLLTIYSGGSQARRYRTCDEGCCVHEYCAFHRICYPRIHCGLGCPDGQCVGQDQQPTGTVQQTADPHVLSERYSYQDITVKDTLSSNTGNVPNRNVKENAISPGNGDGYKPHTHISTTDVSDGICMPYKPCGRAEFCGLGHSCTFNYNLGYHVCQYNLDIGSTLCYDNKGNPALQPLS